MNSDFIFSTVQTINNEEHMRKFSPNHFDLSLSMKHIEQEVKLIKRLLIILNHNLLGRQPRQKELTALIYFLYLTTTSGMKLD